MWLKKTNHSLYKILFLSLIGFQAQAQELLKLEDAVKIALENNYEIKVSSNNSKIDETNSSAGNAGMLPNITANVVNTNAKKKIKLLKEGLVKERVANKKETRFIPGLSSLTE